MDQTRPTQNLKKKYFLKIYPNIFIFYITLITFYYYSNKKITTKQKISFFYTKHSLFFSHINQIYCGTSQLPQVQSIAKHSLGFGSLSGFLTNNQLKLFGSTLTIVVIWSFRELLEKNSIHSNVPFFL